MKAGKVFARLMLCLTIAMGMTFLGTAAAHARWVVSDASQPVPTGAVLAGTEQHNSNTGNNLYVCRVAFAGGVHPGKLVEPWRWCHFGWGGYERASTTYDVLVDNGTWEMGTTRGALIGGHEADGTPLYLCQMRAHIHGIDHGTASGKVVGNTCHIGYGGYEWESSSYSLFYVAPPSDLDLDGISDEYEAWLLQKFAPRIFLHSNENRWPVTVEWLLGRSTLRYSHDGCGDCSILPYGSVNASNITEHFHQNKHSPFYYQLWKACSHKGRSNSSASYTGGTNDTFFLQYDDGAHNGNRWGPWALYGHAYSKNGYMVLQYWQLYAFNDSFASANHEGDWEFSAVAINSEEVPQGVAFYRHGRVEVYAPDEVQWVGTHHVTYSAKGSHGQYANRVSSGDCDGTRVTDRAQGFADSCDTGFAWDSWDPWFGPIVNIGEKFAPINGANWLRYSGKWGEIGAASDFVTWTSGPPGPAYRDSNHWSWAPPEAVEGSGGVGVHDDNCRMPPLDITCSGGQTWIPQDCACGCMGGWNTCGYEQSWDENTCSCK